MTKAYLIINKCGEGVVMTTIDDAVLAVAKNDDFASGSSLALAMNEIYPDENRIVEIEIPAEVQP